MYKAKKGTHRGYKNTEKGYNELTILVKFNNAGVSPDLIQTYVNDFNTPFTITYDVDHTGEYYIEGLPIKNYRKLQSTSNILLCEDLVFHLSIDQFASEGEGRIHLRAYKGDSTNHPSDISCNDAYYIITIKEYSK